MGSDAAIREMPKELNDTANVMLQEVQRALTENIHWKETTGRRNKQTAFGMCFLPYSTTLPVFLR